MERSAGMEIARPISQSEWWWEQIQSIAGRSEMGGREGGGRSRRSNAADKGQLTQQQQQQQQQQRLKQRGCVATSSSTIGNNESFLSYCRRHDTLDANLCWIGVADVGARPYCRCRHQSEHESRQTHGIVKNPFQFRFDSLFSLSYLSSIPSFDWMNASIELGIRSA